MTLARLLAAVLLALAAASARAGDKPLSLDALYHPEQRVDFGGRPPKNLSWIDDARFHWPRTDPQTLLTDHLVAEARSGAVRPLFDAERLARALVAEAGVTLDEARRMARRTGVPTGSADESLYAFDRQWTWLVLPAGGDLFRFDFATSRLTRLTRAAGEEEEPTISPDGRWVAFVRGHDLHVVDRDGRAERRLTRDGSPDVLNGKLDWVYQEEVYGRGRFRAHWWSPDSARLAFLRLDETGVPRHTLVDDVAHEQVVQRQEYPRPGERNPAVRLGLATVAGGEIAWADLSRYASDEPLVVDVAWTPDSRQVSAQVQDRAQTWLDLLLIDPPSGTTRVVLRETTRAWVEPHGSPHWLRDGSFLWLSERTGWKHLYRVNVDGAVQPVTRGEWEARALLAVDEARGLVYFAGTERSVKGGDVYRVRLDGSEQRRLTESAGTHSAVFNPAATLFLDTWSDVRTPPQVRLHDREGREVRVIHATRPPALDEYRLAAVEFLQVPARDGFALEALLIRPADFDPSRRYPVLQATYAGPHAQRVKDAWCDSCLFHHLVAQQGVVVFVLDNRTASGKGAVSAWPAYRQLGVTEMADIEDGVSWLKRQPWVDGDRIGIEGWSYGGFMTSYALTHSRSFRMGIAGAPVVDWRLYDSIYTERYMDTPARNAEGYRRTSVIEAAAALHGDLLLVHGLADDNVHPQNTHQLAFALQQAGRPFRLLTYSRQRHAFRDRRLIHHLRSAMLDFIEETLVRGW